MFKELFSSCGHVHNYKFSDTVSPEIIKKYELLFKIHPCKPCEEHRKYLKNTYEKLVKMLGSTSDIKLQHEILDTIGDLEKLGDIPII